MAVHVPACVHLMGAECNQRTPSQGTCPSTMAGLWGTRTGDSSGRDTDFTLTPRRRPSVKTAHMLYVHAAQHSNHHNETPASVGTVEGKDGTQES